MQVGDEVPGAELALAPPYDSDTYVVQSVDGDGRIKLMSKTNRHRYVVTWRPALGVLTLTRRAW